VIADHAAALAERGLWLFPVAGKLPLTENGFKDALNDPVAVRALFVLHGNATGIGIDCGRSGLLVVDLDGPRGRGTWTRLLLEHGSVRTLEAATGRRDGGRHLYFATRDKRAKSTAKKLGEGIDTRGRGGYVVCPPSLHPSGTRYRWAERRPIVEAPDWLLQALTPPLDTPVGEPGQLRPGERCTAYGRAALGGIADHVLASVEGTRNDRFHAAARRAGRLVAAGELDESLAFEVLHTAATAIGLGPREIAATWGSGFQYGLQYPAARAAQ
jgi:hypothetical protein